MQLWIRRYLEIRRVAYLITLYNEALKINVLNDTSSYLTKAAQASRYYRWINYIHADPSASQLDMYKQIVEAFQTVVVVTKIL